MESRILVLFLRLSIAASAIALLGGCASQGRSDDGFDASRAVISPDIERREVTEADIDTENFEVGAFAGFMSVEDFGSNTVYGVNLSYHVSEHLFVSGNYGQTDTEETSYERLSGGASLLADDERTLKYYDVSFGYNLLPGEVFIGSDWAMNSALYVVAGAGNTDFAGDDYFTIVLGAGYRVLATDSLAFHFNVRDHMFDSDLLGEDKTTHNIEFSLGLTAFF